MGIRNKSRNSNWYRYADKKWKKVIVINILNFKRNSFLKVARMKFEKSLEETYVNMGYKIEEEMATENLEMIFLEIPKFLKIRQNKEAIERL